MKKLIFVGILGLFVLGSCNNSTVHTHTMNTIMPRKDIITRQRVPIILMKANVAENTTMKRPMDITSLPKRTVMKSSFRRQKLKQPVSR